MFFSKSNIVHTETIELLASPSQVREFIMTPQRILDYYPSPIEGGVIEPNSKIFCRGRPGVSMLAIVHHESNEDCIVVEVTAATGIDPPFTESRIRSARFFTMLEDWHLEETSQGTRLTKTWRDIVKYKMKFLPLGMIVRRAAITESKELRLAWNQAAQLGA